MKDNYKKVLKLQVIRDTFKSDCMYFRRRQLSKFELYGAVNIILHTDEIL